MDSNHNKQYQKLPYYRYTKGQKECSRMVPSRSYCTFYLLCKRPTLCALIAGRGVDIFCGETGIRTPEPITVASFQDWCIQPLYHLSVEPRDGLEPPT